MTVGVLFAVWCALACVPLSTASTAEVGRQRKAVHNPLERIEVHAVQQLHDPSISISVDKQVLASSGTWVTVTWSGVRDPQYLDWIALYIPADADPSITAPSKFKWATDAHTHMVNGSGTLRFKLINYHRPDMRFAFMRSGLQSPVRSAVTTIMRFANPNEPIKGHLALGHEPSQMVVQWQSWNASDPQVQWATSPDLFSMDNADVDGGNSEEDGGVAINNRQLHLNHQPKVSSGNKHEIKVRMIQQVDARSVTVTQSEICGGIALQMGWVELGLLHHAIITGITPGRRYYYRYGDPMWGWSKVHSFLAHPAPGEGYDWTNHQLRPASTSATSAYLRQVDDSVRPETEVEVETAGGKAGRASAGTLRGVGDGGGDGGVRLVLGRRSAARERDGESMLGGRVVQEMVGGPAGVDVGDGGSEGGGSVRGSEMQVPESLFAGQKTVRVLLSADVGQAEEDGANSLQEAMYPSLNTTRWWDAEGHTFTLLLHSGDLAYSRGYSTQWDNFMSQIEPVASRMPYMVLPGNHERDFPGSGDRFDEVMDSGGECGVMFAKRFRMPTQDLDLMWYSFDHGPVHFLTYSTEHITAPGSPQYDFIAKDLASVNRSITPWVVVAGHRPIYVSSTNDIPPDGDQMVASQLQKDIEPLLIKYKVDLTLHGHHHTYQRTCPMAYGECVGYDKRGRARGPVHLIIGHGGAGLSTNIQEPPPPFIERTVLWWGYARMQASHDIMSIEIISSLDGGLMDSLVLRAHGKA